MSWIDKKATFKPEKVVIRINDEAKSFCSVAIPTSYYPLSSNSEYAYKIFRKENTEICEREEVLRIFDTIPYRIGHCYTNADELFNKLTSAGIEAKIWAGWLFVCDQTLPIHHCWVTVGNSVLDLADDFRVKFGQNTDVWANIKTAEEFREVEASFYSFCRENRIKNRQRCAPVGKVGSNDWLYIGAECESGDAARKIYQNLIRKYPNHVVEANCFADGTNQTQRKIFDVTGGVI